jgi:simple sugar transport system ATP-binding protein
MAPRLALDAIRRHYGPVIALDGASLTVMPGEVHALLGENGAGKSTLMKVAFGLEQPDAGVITIDGTEALLRSPRDAMQRGIGMVQQHFALVDAMTVAENVALGGAGPLNMQHTTALVRTISAATGLSIDADAYVRDLPIGAQQRVEIIKALARETRTLILDEPTAVLAPQEAAELLAWTRRFADGGGAVVLIAHKLREVLSVADRVTVLRRGRTVLTARAAEVTELVLAEAMLGTASPTTSDAAEARRPVLHHDTSGTPSTTVVTLSKVSARDQSGAERLRDVSLTVRAGEIVGIAAVEGAGQHELLRIIAGRITPSRGTVDAPAVVGFVPEDRHRDAVVLEATLTENVALRGAGARRGVMPWNRIRQETEALLRLRDVRATSASVPIRTLSGGNQQKLVIGRELAATPAVLVVENPTRGLDIRATGEVHAALRAARDAGTAVIVYSSDLDEVLGLADRLVVVTAGRVRTVTGDREVVGRAMLTVDG